MTEPLWLIGAIIHANRLSLFQPLDIKLFRSGTRRTAHEIEFCKNQA
jgi:hypothetical protein